jgi:hypothetical protein
MVAPISTSRETHRVWNQAWAPRRAQNHYGSKSRHGTGAAPVFYALLETAKLVGVAPARYLREAALADARGQGRGARVTEGCPAACWPPPRTRPRIPIQRMRGVGMKHIAA